MTNRAKTARPGMAALAMALLAGCGAPQPASPPPSAPARPARGQCFNNQYRFTCAVPEGYVITDETDGPGVVMTLVQRARTSQSEANITVRVEPSKAKAVETALDYRLKRVYGIGGAGAPVERRQVRYGEADGLVAEFERRFASGTFKIKAFAFLRGGNVYIIDFTAPADAYERESDALGRFADSLVFGPE